MWLFKSSIGKKFLMALTGICLVLFVTFHVLMNAVAICWPVAYNKVCMFLGANWYALIASAGLGLLVVLHIIDSLVLTIQNRKARGNDRYAVSARPKSVEWSSQNMLVLGIVVFAFLVIHLWQFWARMQCQELLGSTFEVNGMPVVPQAGTLFLQLAFSEIWTPVAYIIGFVALWFHMNHGFWSMWQTVGLNNTPWLNRWKTIGNWWVSIVIALFIVQAVVFTINARNKFYLTDEALVEQYSEMYVEHYTSEMDELTAQIEVLQAEFMEQTKDMQSDYSRYEEIKAIADSIETANKDLFERIELVGNLLRAAQTKSLQPQIEKIGEKKAPEAPAQVEENQVATGVSEN